MCNWFQNKSPTHTFAVDWDTWHGNWVAPCYFNGAAPTGSHRWDNCLQRHLACEGLYGCHILPWLCAKGGCTIICIRLDIYPVAAGLGSFYWCAVVWCAQISEYIMPRCSYSFACTIHYLIIWRYWTSKNVCEVYCVEWVFKVKSIISINFYEIHGAVCIQLTHFSYVDFQNTCTLSSYHHHHQIGSMTHLPLFKIRPCNNGMRCVPFYCHIII